MKIVMEGEEGYEIESIPDLKRRRFFRASITPSTPTTPSVPKT
jgi:hypothetical protein